MGKREKALNKLWNDIEALHAMYDIDNEGEVPKELETAYDILSHTIRNYEANGKYRRPTKVVRRTEHSYPRCPRCDAWLVDGIVAYCVDCGQALSWED